MGTTEGHDDTTRTTGADALQRLMDEIPPGPEWIDGTPMSNQDAADSAVALTDDATVRSALRHLLTLHLTALETANDGPVAPAITVRPTSRQDVTGHMPQDTADDAYLQIGPARIAVDPSSRETLNAGIDVLTGIQYMARTLESHLRVIHVAPQHSPFSKR
jgi:hypothetical protein